MAPHPQRLAVASRSWTLARPITTPRGVATEVEVVVASLGDGDSRGRGEGVPLWRYGEDIASVTAQLDAMKGAVFSGLTRETLQDALPAGAARNALDCAFWDIEAKRAYCPVADLAGIGALRQVATALTLALDTPDGMAALAAANRTRPMFKMHLGDDADADRVRAVRAAAPAARLIVDANESWTAARFGELIPTLVDCRVELIEQPLAADDDGALANLECPIPLCADESCRAIGDLDRLDRKYAVVNVTLDKVGGLTAALALATEARRRGLRIMAGGVVGTSLGVAPALLLAQQADIVDLGGPLLLAADRVPGLEYEGNAIHPPDPNFWG